MIHNLKHKWIAFIFLFWPHLFSLAAVNSQNAKVQAIGWTTAFDGSKSLQVISPKELILQPCDKSETAHSKVQIIESKTSQSMNGLGAALTESSAILISQLDSETRKNLINELFGVKAPFRINILRVPIGATDFSTANYSCADAFSTDINPTVDRLFNFHRCMEYILPILIQIKKVNPNLKIIATPWSPPAWMKNSKDLVGGKLLPAYYKEYAHYLALFLRAMQNNGVSVDYLTILNEPTFVPLYSVSYPWANMESHEQALFISQFLVPELKQSEILKNVKILGYDHNWDNWIYAAHLLMDPEVNSLLTGTAFHCYGGDYNVVKKIRNLAPSKEIHMTECSAGAWSPDFEPSFLWTLENLVIGSFAAGSESLVYWNLLLDSNGGPKNGGCTNCRGVLNLSENRQTYLKSPEYFAMAQAASVLDPKAIHLESLSRDINKQIAFKNPDGSLAWIGLNFQKKSIQTQLQFSGGCMRATLPPRSAISLRWK